MGELALPIVMMLILYFVWIRPAGKERRQQQAMLDALKRGDEIVTSSGILGTISDISDKVMTIEVAKNVKIRVLKSAVSKRVADLSSDDEKKSESSTSTKKS
ncbi:MAG: preprotein translocase subunit YajC [Deltaproteobacteria bacterium]